MSAVKKMWVTVLGWVLVVGGIIAMPLPGPGLLILFAGLAILSQEYEWAEKRVDPVKQKAIDLAQDGVSSWPKIIMSGIFAIWVIFAGVALCLDPKIPHLFTIPKLWIIDPIPVGPHIPMAGLGVGISVVISGIVAFGLLVYSYFVWHDEAAEARRQGKDPSEALDNSEYHHQHPDTDRSDGGHDSRVGS